LRAHPDVIGRGAGSNPVFPTKKINRKIGLFLLVDIRWQIYNALIAHPDAIGRVAGSNPVFPTKNLNSNVGVFYLGISDGRSQIYFGSVAWFNLKAVSRNVSLYHRR